MPVLGVVLVLDDAADATRDGVVAALAGVSEIALGEAAAHRLPAVLESDSERAAEAQVDALRRVPGVAAVDVVYADFEDLLAQPLEAVAGEEA
jgi:nitrate reductase NapAB chaperone NapD